MKTRNLIIGMLFVLLCVLVAIKEPHTLALLEQALKLVIEIAKEIKELF